MSAKRVANHLVNIGAKSTINVTKLGTAMIEAARKAVAQRAALQIVVETELRRLAGSLAEIGAMVARGEIKRDRGEKLVELYRQTVSSVLHSVEGMAHLTATDALTAAMRVAGAALNRALGFTFMRATTPTETSGPITADFKAGKDL